MTEFNSLVMNRKEPEFFELADRFIELANQANQDWPVSRVSAAILYAAARYNAFNFFSSDGAEENEAKAIDYYCEEYRTMLEEHFREFRDEKASID